MAAWTFAKLGAEIYRLFVVDGNPGSGKHKPVKTDVQEWCDTVEATITALKVNNLDYYLTAQKDIFISNTGNDTTGDGTSGNPFLTLQRAWTEACKFNLNNQKIRIRMLGTLPVTFSSTGTLLQTTAWPLGSGTVEIQGDGANPQNYILTASGASPNSTIQVRQPQGAVTLQFTGVQITNTGTNSAALDHNGQGKVVVDRCNFAATGTQGQCIKISGNNAHVEMPNVTNKILAGTHGTGVLCDSGYFISVGTIEFVGNPTFTGAVFECNFGGRMFLTAFAGTINAASLTRAIVKDRALLRVHTNSPIPGSGAVNVQPGSVYDDGGFAIQNSCYPVAHALVTFSGGVPSLNSDSYGFNNVIDTATGRTTMTLNSRMKNSTYCVIAVVQDTADASTKIVYTSDQVFIVETYSAAVALADLNYSVAVFGSQRADF